ncbi:ORF V: Enzymatic polyprotein [Labeo rohita]|uniref:ORF V: Enzymatic polyprotein n=1 Tax=Labeo rohita TaxID=84645 RepID=A0ABQ8LYT9_LABRO|nr:ORF V: Enzymatic polyprotein [Labeo rohita]
MSMATLRSRLSFVRRLPSSSSRKGFSGCYGEALGGPPGDGAERSAGQNPAGFRSTTWSRAGRASPLVLPQRKRCLSQQGEQSAAEAGASAAQRPSVVAVPSKAEAELSAMLLRAADGIGLEVPKVPPPDPSRLDDWFLGTRSAASPRSPPVPFFPEVHDELVRAWRAPYSARSRSTSSALECPELCSCQTSCLLGFGLGANIRQRGNLGRRPPHRGHVGQRSADPTGGQAGSLVRAAQPVPVVGPDGMSRLCDSVRQAPAQIQEHPFHFCPLGHGCLCPACGDCSLTGERRNRACPSSRDEVGVLQPLLHRAQEERWVTTNPGSSSVESVPSQAAVQNAHFETHPFVRSTPGLVCGHRPEGRVLSRLDFALTQTLSTVCFRGSSVSVQSAPIWPVPVPPRLYEGCGGGPEPAMAAGCSHSQLSRRLAHHGSLVRTVVRTQGPGAPAPQPSGPSGQPREEQTLPSAEDLFSRHGAGLDQYDSLPHQQAHAVGAELSEIFQAQNSGSSQNISEAPGAYGSRSNATRPASYETASALATRSSPKMGMAPWHTPDWRFPAVSPPIQPVVRPCLPTGRSSLRTDASSTGWGAVCNGQAASGSWTGPRLLWHINCLELLAVLLALRRFLPMLRHKHVLVRTDNTATVAYINHQGGLRSRRMSQLARHLLLWSQTRLKSLRAVHIPGELNRAADQLSRQPTHPGEWRLHPQTVQLIWSRFGEAQIDLEAPPRQGRAGTQLASGAQVRLSPSEPPCTDTVQDQGGRGAGSAGCAILAHPDLVRRPHAPRDSPSLEDSPEEGPSFSGDGHNLAPASQSLEPARVASGWDTVDLAGLPQAVIETITQSRAPSTRQAYALRWGLFVDWCASRREDPQRCPIAVVLSFLQEKLERRLSPSTLKVYVAAIAAYHDAVDGESIGKHHLVVRFLRVELKFLSLKTALLTALASIKRVGDLQAFSVNEACLEFRPADSHVVLRPRPGYVPKVPTTPFRDQVVNLQALPPEEADPALALLCPVRALRIYVDRTRSFRRSEQLFVCFGGQQKGNAVSKQRLAHWVVDAISLAYESQGEPCPLGVRAHSTRSVASSYALAHGASLADICRAAGWATPNTFARFYNLCVEPVSSRVLSMFPPVNLGPPCPAVRTRCGVVRDCAPTGSPSPRRLWLNVSVFSTVSQKAVFSLICL